MAMAVSLTIFNAPQLQSPSLLCSVGSQFAPYFGMKTNDGRKRKLGISYIHEEHKQADYGAYAISAGRQTKNTRVQPLIAEELEPGRVIEEMLKLNNPLMEKSENFRRKSMITSTSSSRIPKWSTSSA